MDELNERFSEYLLGPHREDEWINEASRVFETAPGTVKVGEIEIFSKDVNQEAKAMADPFVCSPRVVLSNVEAFEVHHWPIVRAYAEKLGLVEVVNRLVPSEMAIDAGTMVLGLVVDTLSGRSPLYHLEAFFEQQDRGLLLGREVEASVFNDDSVGRVLDRVFEAGTQTIFSALSQNAVERFTIPIQHVHHDTTSISLYGDYTMAPEHTPPFEITYGHSKDHRPDLKQFVLSLLCVSGNVPILGKITDGNASDKTVNNDLLNRISDHLACYGVAPQAYVYLADSALITPKNLKQLSDKWFISRLPATYSEHERVIAEAVAADHWVELGEIADRRSSKSRPVARYKVADSTVMIDGQSYRAVVVHSSSHDRRRQKKLDRQCQKSRQQVETVIKSYQKIDYACEADARAEADRVERQRGAYHWIEANLEPRPQYAPGRPKADGSRTIQQMRYALRLQCHEDHEAMERAREHSGCFVLLTNLPTQGEGAYSTEQILRTYKEQHGIEKNFGFLKDDAIVNALFLKTPERLEALGLILLIALLIWRLMEFHMRRHLNDTQTHLLGWDDKPTDRPTAYMVTRKFKGLLTLKHDNQRRLAQPLSSTQYAFLRALGLDETVFLQPGAQARASPPLFQGYG